MKKIIWIFFVCMFLNGCTQIDNYMFGKDNSPEPAKLKPIQQRLNLVKKWSISTGRAEKSDKFLKLKPIVAGNVLYTAQGDGQVQALDNRTAQVIWRKQLKHHLVSGPVVSNGRVIVGTADAKIVSLSVKSGDILWKAGVSSDPLSLPGIANDKVIVKTIDGNLYAFNAKNGNLLWVVNHGAPRLILKASSSPVIYNNTVLVGFSDGRLDTVDLDSGAIIWEKGVAYAQGASDVERLVDIDADPIVQGNRIYLASYQGFIGVMSLDNGQFIWRKPASTYKNLAIDEENIYMTDSDDILWAYDRQNGQVKWKQPALKARGLTEPVIIGSRLVVGDKIGYIHMLTTKNGEIIARTRLNGPIYTGPAILNNNMFVMTGNGKLDCISIG